MLAESARIRDITISWIGLHSPHRSPLNAIKDIPGSLKVGDREDLGHLVERPISRPEALEVLPKASASNPTAAKKHQRPSKSKNAIDDLFSSLE